MILFLWSIVAGAVGYLKRQRLAQWMRDVLDTAKSNKHQLILRRTSITPPTVRPWLHWTMKSTPGACSLLWSEDGTELVMHQHMTPLELRLWRVFDELAPVKGVSSEDVVYFTALSRPRNDSDQDRGNRAESSSTFSIETICTPLAWRSDDDQITVLFGCSSEEFVDVACAWIYGRAVFREIFQVEEISTEVLSSDLAQLINLQCGSGTMLPSGNANGKCNGTAVNGCGGVLSHPKPITQSVRLSVATGNACCSRSMEAITSSVNAVENSPGSIGQSDGSRPSVLCSLEQLCLSDILAAKDLCQSLGTFDGEMPVDSDGEASVYHTCNRDLVESGPVTIAPSAEQFQVGSSSSVAGSRATFTIQGDYSQEIEEQKQSGQLSALTPLSVDIYSGISSDWMSVSLDHLSPCHGFNSRLLDRHWYSTWRCDSLDSSPNSAVVMRQPTASLPSRSASASKRRSVRGRSGTVSSDILQIPNNMNRRWSLPSPPQERSRSSSSGRSKFRTAPVVKPPNVLIYTGDNDDSSELYTRLSAVIGRSVHPEKYTLYRLKRSRFLVDPWCHCSVCIILADTAGLDDRCWQRLFDYFKSGGRMFFICENRLLASLTDVASTKKRYGILKLAFDTHQQNRNHKDFKEFLKRLSKALKKSSLCEHFNVLGADGRPRYTLSFVREESTPLILYMQNSQDRAVALFSDMTLEAVLTAGRSLIHEILQRLGLELTEPTTVPMLTCGYLVLQDEVARTELAESFLSLGRIDDGHTSIEFFRDGSVPPDRVTATRVYLPVWVNAENRLHDFDMANYFEHLKTDRMGRCVLFVPVATSTMAYFEGLLAKLPDEYAVVAIARYQLEGRGRGGNRFLSPDGCAMFTVGLRVPAHYRLAQSPGYVQHLLALAAVDSICCYRKELANFHLRLKWPNDIYYGVGRLIKVGGVLVNCLARSDTLFFIAGLGLNISNSNPTTCVNDMLPPELPPFQTEQVIALTLTRFEKLMDLFERRGHDGILPLYYKYWLHNYQDVTLAETGERVLIRGLDKRGYLEVRSRQNGRVFSLQPDGNTFDMMHNLIKIKE